MMKSRNIVHREERGGSPREGTCFEEMCPVLQLGTLAETSQGFRLQADLPSTVFFFKLASFKSSAAMVSNRGKATVLPPIT